MTTSQGKRAATNKAKNAGARVAAAAEHGQGTHTPTAPTEHQLVAMHHPDGRTGQIHHESVSIMEGHGFVRTTK